MSTVVFSDDFSSGTIDTAKWLPLYTGGELRGSGSGGNGSSGTDGFIGTNNNSLLLRGGGSDERHVTTQSLSTVSGAGVISFDLIQGSDDNGGEDPDNNEGLLLAYSIDGGTTFIDYVHFLTEKDFVEGTTPDVSYPAGATPSQPFWGLYVGGEGGGYSEQINWKTFTVPIPSAVIGESNVQFKWYQKGYNASQAHFDVWSIDNVEISLSSPTLTSAVYDVPTVILTVTGSDLVANSGSTNDIDISKLTVTGEGGNTYTLTSNDVELTSATAFSVTLNPADQLQFAGLLNKNGTSSDGGTTYNIAAASGWNPGAGSSPADATGNAITVSNLVRVASTPERDKSNSDSSSSSSSNSNSSTAQTLENLLINGRRYWTHNVDSLTNQSNINFALLNDNDYLEVTGGKNNFANGNKGDDRFVLRAGQKGQYFGGKGADTFEVFGGIDSYINGHKGADQIILRGGLGRYLGGDDGDRIEVLAADSGSWVNGNRGNDFITGAAAGVTYRGGKDDDVLAVSQGDVWGDLGVDTFRGVSGDGYALIQDYTVGEDKIDLSMVQGGSWTNVDNGLKFTDASGDQIMLLVGINDLEQVTLM